MDLLPTIMVPTAGVTIARAAYVYIRRVLRRGSPDAEKLRRRASTWVLQAVAHFVGRRARRAWLLHYALDQYVTSLYSRHDKLIIPGLVKLSIDRCYIPLELRAGQMTEANQVISSSGATLVLGDPGTGKSALLSRIIRSLCVECKESPETARLPVYVRLHQLVPYLPDQMNRDMKPDEAIAVLEEWFADYETKPIDLYDSDRMISSLATATKHGIVTLLDGLDEIGTDDLWRVESFLLALMQYMDTAPGQNLVVITSRRQALDLTPQLAAGGASKLMIVELRPFSPAAIYSFLLRWPYRHNQHPAKEANRIFGQLKLNSTLLDTCSNPLALALYVNRDFRLQELGYAEAGLQPDTRASFFTDIVDYLMVQRRSDQLNKATPTRAVREARIDFFVAVVDEHIRSRDHQFGAISEEMILKHAASLARQGQSPGEALSDLAKDTGIIARDRDGSWRFIHESFLNYFIACSIANVHGNKPLEQLFRHLKLQPLEYLEGFYLACGLMASRHSPYLATMLTELGRSTFVGRHYPRAVLESQSYFRTGFVERIKFYCGFWKSHRDDITLFRDLVAVLIDYERSCAALGRTPEVSARGQFRNELAAQNSILEVAMLDIEIAMKIANDDSMTEILAHSAPEDAIVALYDPDVAARLRDTDVDADPELAAVVAEAALRSSLLMDTLSRPLRSGLQKRTFLYPDQPWADSWPIRGSRFGYVLSLALPYVQSLPSDKKAHYPHLQLLTFARPIRRLRNEMLFGDWRMSVFLLSLLVIAIGPFWLAGVAFEIVAFAALASFLLILVVFRQAVRRGLITPPSLRMLNKQPLDTRGVAYSERATRLVVGEPAVLNRWRVRTPHGSDGTITAAYTHDLPFLWRRFCPQLGDQRISRIGCASIQQLWTEDVRRLVRR